IDSLMRPGSERNVAVLQQAGVEVIRGDVRCATDFDALPKVDWVIDAAANPSVLAGLSATSGSRQLLEHNLLGSINVLEFCRRHGAGFILLSTSRVYSIAALAGLPLIIRNGAFVLDEKQSLPAGISFRGVKEEFSTAAPISLYGSTKLALEVLALEYANSFGFPVWIDRCGVMAGAGQFGTAEQGIFSYWIHAYAARQPLCYIGFDGKGYQSRDVLHPDDLAGLLWKQMHYQGKLPTRLFTVGGGRVMSLNQLSAWCAERLGEHHVTGDLHQRPFDLPWLAMDSTLAESTFGWRAEKTLNSILNEIMDHAHQHPGWLDLARGGTKSRA
ncbi:MAG: NAD-dependent epimerase/dehydratase family protein, partial [Patescibacteria group bacterium]